MVVRGSVWDAASCMSRSGTPRVQGGGNEGVPQGMRPDGLGDPGAAGDPADDPPGAVPVQPTAGPGEEQWSLSTLADRKVDGPGGARGEGMVTTLPPLRVITRVRWPFSMPMASMVAPVASDTRSPFRASREIS